jgi:1-acyl-sn-glycerol-3-phosphate acyltransferase
MNLIYKLFGLSNSFLSFDGDVGRIGWVNGCKRLLKNLGIQYKLESAIPKKGPTLIYSNHPTGLDPYLLTSALERNDSYFWGDIYQSKKGKNIKDHIIEIAPRPFWTIIRRPLTNWLGYIYMRLTTPALSKDVTKKINGEVVDKTVDLLKNGHQVIVFPSGGEYEFLPKKSGLSKVITECKKRKIKVNIYEIKIQDFGELLLMLHFVFKIKIKAILK